ncbi:tetranectin-like [Patiria miniata]|uniref:C-type lectin domain-containing protein n=1 Tax=Patiria miniata TaxID=46514 RepID=A0A914A5H1_PATMI|nr:tetranectin-like [Patiria miniata]
MMVPERFIFGFISFHLMMGCSGGNEVCKASGIGRKWACPPPWIQWGGKCYKAITESLTWFQAKDECIKMGGVLVAPQTQEETDFLVRLQPPRFWINCNDIREEGIWECQDGPREVEFRNWATENHQPDNGKGIEDCGEVVPYPAGKWNDAECKKQRPAVCKLVTSCTR